ncbi:concanavalin A-like lectin/glucanase domain-containing protein [Limtongia smithiae]|uniref:concanavalin A-like lectin/glucanase domain-containing protein n=1 Tax=Limtongia smithiae TaxID=1125753 RepID=UPI0034CD7C75
MRWGNLLSGIIILSSTASRQIFAVAQEPDPGLSLANPISWDKNTITEWDKLGSVTVEPDRIFLTVPGDKGQSGAIWTRKQNPYTEWTTQVVFRASGGERAGGGLVIWYTAAKEAGPIYGARDFWDGLAIMIDSVGNTGGNVRGHLNDGSIGYAALPNPTKQSFAQCPLRYRNTGTMINVKVTSGPKLLKVEVEGRLCFESHEIQLPQNYYLGISAASYDNPDSFEIFTVKTTGRITAAPQKKQQVDNSPMPPQSPPQRQSQQPMRGASAQGSSGVGEVREELSSIRALMESHFRQLREEIEALNSMKPLIEKLDQRVGRVESAVSRTESQFHGATVNMHESTKQNIASEVDKLTSKLDALDAILNQHTTSIVSTMPNLIADALKQGSGSSWIMIIIFLVLLVGAIAGYGFYKYRYSDYHAKYL